MENRSGLLMRIAKRAPWLIDGDESVFPEPVVGKNEQILDGLSGKDVTIITDGGLVYRHCQLIKTSNDEIKIAKPTGWESSIESFHVFFLNDDSKWNFFEVNGGTVSDSHLCAKIPGEYFFLQKRRHKRIAAPIGTIAIFRDNNSLMATAHVQDISLGGMLICDNAPGNRFHVDSFINEIFITLRPKVGEAELSAVPRTLPLISQGKVVRAFVNQELCLSYYGISFLYESVYVKQSLDHLLKGVH